MERWRVLPPEKNDFWVLWWGGGGGGGGWGGGGGGVGGGGVVREASREGPLHQNFTWIRRKREESEKNKPVERKEKGAENKEGTKSKQKLLFVNDFLSH